MVLAKKLKYSTLRLRLIFFLFILLFIVQNAVCKSFVISGLVKDSLTQAGLPYAAVQFKSIKDSNLTYGVITDFDGVFKMENIQAGAYLIKVSFIGYNTIIQNVNVDKEHQTFVFLMMPLNQNLTGVEITGNREQVERTLEKTTINIPKEVSVSGTTALDLLRTIPSVDVDEDGKISYRGSDKVVILINGEPSVLSTTLNQIPGEQVLKVELINNPSARYEAEGMSGIINIVLKTTSQKTSNTSFSVFAGYPETGGFNVNFSSSKPKYRFFASLGLNHTTKFQTKEHLRTNVNHPLAFNYYQFDRQDEILNNGLFNCGFDYSFSKRHKANLSFSTGAAVNSAERSILYKTLDSNEFSVYQSIKDIQLNLDNLTIESGLNDVYRFSNGKSILRTSFNFSLLNQLQIMKSSQLADYVSNTLFMQNTFSGQNNMISRIQTGFEHLMKDSSKIEIGYSFEFKKLVNDFRSEIFDSLNSIWNNQPDLRNHFDFRQSVHAIYLNYNKIYRKLELQAGLRLEYTDIHLINQRSDSYLQLFPSVNASWNIKPRHSIFAAYTRRINRPTNKMLSPFSEEYADITNMHIGNPNLQPELVNSFEIGNRYGSKVFSGFNSVYVRLIDDAISRVKFAADDSALWVTFMNLSGAQLFGLEFNSSIKISKWLSVNLNLNLFRTHLFGKYQLNEIDKWTNAYSFSGNAQIKLSPLMSMQFSGFYRSPLPSVMGTYIGRYMVDAGISRKILKNKGSLSLRITDVFNIYRYGLDLEAVDLQGYTYTQTNRRKNESQYFILSFSYNIEGKESGKQQKKVNFFLDEFDK